MRGTVRLKLVDMAQQRQCVRLMRSCWLEPFVEKDITRTVSIVIL
jgi:hypothetical protein